MTLLNILKVNFIFDLSFLVIVIWFIIKFIKYNKKIKKLEISIDTSKEKIKELEENASKADEKIKVLIQNPQLARKMFFTANKN